MTETSKHMIDDIERWCEVDLSNITISDVIEKEEILSAEYSKITKPYRDLFQILAKIKHNKRDEEIRNCDHNYVRYSEYHNERYYVCSKCNHEK